MRPRLVLWMLLSLVVAGAAHAEEMSLAQAEQALLTAEGLPAKGREESGLRYHVGYDLVGAFRAAASRDPARAYTGLGRCQALLGDYEQAASSFRKALETDPGYGVAKGWLLEAYGLAQVAQATLSQLPKGSRVIRIEPLPGDRLLPRSELRWVMLSAKQITTGEGPPYFDVAFDNARLSVVLQKGNGPPQIQQSVELNDTWFSNTANALQLYVLDEMPPKVIAEAVMIGASWSPAHIDAFAWREGKLIKLLALTSDEPMWIQDLKGDGCHEIGDFHAVGDEMSHAEQPRWTNVYAYQDGRYQIANGDFPQEFTALTSEIRETLGRYPGDYELLKYLGVCYEIAGDRTAALDAYREAESRLVARGLPELEGGAWGAPDTWEMADIRSRIRRLGQ